MLTRNPFGLVYQDIQQIVRDSGALPPGQEPSGDAGDGEAGIIDPDTGLFKAYGLLGITPLGDDFLLG